MFIRLTYFTGNGKKVEKDFNEPMEVIGYIYRCWEAARRAASGRRINEMLNARVSELPEEVRSEIS